MIIRGIMLQKQEQQSNSGKWPHHSPASKHTDTQICTNQPTHININTISVSQWIIHNRLQPLLAAFNSCNCIAIPLRRIHNSLLLTEQSFVAFASYFLHLFFAFDCLCCSGSSSGVLLEFSFFIINAASPQLRKIQIQKVFHFH